MPVLKSLREALRNARLPGYSSIVRILSFLSRVHYHLIVVAQIGERAFVAAGMLKDADALAVAEEGFMEIVDRAGILREQGLQEGVGGFSAHFFPDQAQTP